MSSATVETEIPARGFNNGYYLSDIIRIFCNDSFTVGDFNVATSY